MYICFFFVLFLSSPEDIFSDLKRENKWERKRETSTWERNINWLPPVRNLTRDWTFNLGMCPGWESNLQPFSVENDALTEPPGQGFFFILKIGVSCPGWRGSVVEHGPANQMVASSVPSQGTCLGWRPGPQWGVCERQPHTDVSLPLFLLPFSSVWK